jgi:T4 bacteriophage base plate protein
LDDLTVDTSKYSDTIMLDESTGMKFRIPSLSDAHDLDTSSIDSVLKLLHNILIIVFDAEQVYEKSDYTFDEFKEWIEGFNDDQLEKILTWVNNIPELRHELVFVCNHCKQENRRLLEGLHAFFRFGDDS